jgi:uncharacterized protein with beta-barrel porin domain
LSAEDVHAAWVRGGAGVRMTEPASRSWVANEQVRYAHAFASEADAMNASFGDAPQSVMAIRSDAVAQNLIQLALGFSARLHSRVILTADYPFSGGSGLRQHSVTVGLDF